MFLPLPPPQRTTTRDPPYPLPRRRLQPALERRVHQGLSRPLARSFPPPSPLKMYGAGTPIPIPDEERLPARSLSCTGSRAGSARSSENGSVKERKEGFFARM